MANLKNAIKQIRKDKKRTERNLKLRADLRTALKKARKAIVAKDKTVDEQITAIQGMLDKAVKKNIIKQNNAARTLSRLHAFKKKSSQ